MEKKITTRTLVSPTFCGSHLFNFFEKTRVVILVIQCLDLVNVRLQSVFILNKYIYKIQTVKDKMNYLSFLTLYISIFTRSLKTYDLKVASSKIF